MYTNSWFQHTYVHGVKRSKCQRLLEKKLDGYVLDEWYLAVFQTRILDGPTLEKMAFTEPQKRTCRRPKQIRMSVIEGQI